MPVDSKLNNTEQPPQPAQATAARKPSRTAGPVIMVAGLFLAVAAVLFVPMMTGGATGAQSAASGPVSSTVETSAAYHSIDEAAAELAFAPALPAMPESARVSSINVLDGKVLEVTYSLAGKTIVYRTAQGADDLSGVYTEFAYTALDETAGVARSFAGSSEAKLHLAVWASEGYSYSLYAEAGVEAEVLHALALSL